MKLPNPPPKTLGVSSSCVDPVPVAWSGGSAGSGAGVGSSAGAQQAAAERGAVTASFVGTVTAMLVVVSLGLYFVLRKATHAGGGELVVFFCFLSRNVWCSLSSPLLCFLGAEQREHHSSCRRFQASQRREQSKRCDTYVVNACPQPSAVVQPDMLQQRKAMPGGDLE